MATPIEHELPLELAHLNLRPRGHVHPSPSDWRDQTLYFLLPDRFSDGDENQRPMFDYTQPDQYHTPDKRAWMEAGTRFQGGTLKGITGQLGYLKALGVTALWVGPIWKQRTDLETYHGYGIQNFLDIDPRFGTRQDLRDLVDVAHEHGIYVLLDIIYNHSGNNWFYDEGGQPRNTLPYRYQPRYEVHGWRSGAGQPIPTIQTLEDGVYPREFQNLDWYTRSGQIQQWDAASWEDPLNPDVQFRRGDFFDLKDIDLEREDTLAAVIKVYQYWIALSDCDGFRIDTVKHIPWEASRNFCSQIREYAESIGKDNFLLLGEVTGGEYMERSYLEIFGRNLDAVLDIGDARSKLISLTKGFGDPQVFFDQFQSHGLMGNHRETGRFHVSIMDDHDMVGSRKMRYIAGNPLSTRYDQAAHAVGLMLTTLGIPCIYYGTEQALNGSEDQHDYSIEPHLGFEDRYIREGLFGGIFGAYETSGCHFFNPNHPTYLRISAIARVRNQPDTVGMALRRGRQYLRELSGDGFNFALPTSGGLVGWSRILYDHDVVVILNSNGVERRSGYVAIDSQFHPIRSTLHVLYRGDWNDEQLRTPPDDETFSVENVNGRSAVKVELPPSGMLILE